MHNLCHLWQVLYVYAKCKMQVLCVSADGIVMAFSDMHIRGLRMRTNALLTVALLPMAV